jgi:hypothetical protein
MAAGTKPDEVIVTAATGTTEDFLLEGGLSFLTLITNNNKRARKIRLKAIRMLTFNPSLLNKRIVKIYSF